MFLVRMAIVKIDRIRSFHGICKEAKFTRTPKSITAKISSIITTELAMLQHNNINGKVYGTKRNDSHLKRRRE
jgi:hypothetical protein